MKISTLANFALTALGVSAQLVSLVAPTPNSRIAAGHPFTATVAFVDTSSSVDVLFLFFGAKSGMAQGDDLGQTKLTTVMDPQFTTGLGGRMVHDVTLTMPMDMINGLDRSYNLTVGEFYTLGAENTPKTHTAQVAIFVVST